MRRSLIVKLRITIVILGAAALLMISSNCNGNNMNNVLFSTSFRRRITSLASSSFSLSSSLSLDNEPQSRYEELPHVISNDLKYRRICTDVHGNILCMTLRYPFEVPLQDESVTQYPSPVDDRFYQLTKPPVLLDGPLLEACRHNTTGVYTNMTDRVYHCLETVSSSYHPDQVVAVFTRQRRRNHNDNANEQHHHQHQRHHHHHDEEDFYGITSPQQRHRLYTFFRGHDIVVVGDSLGPYVASAISDHIGTCTKTNVQVLDKRNLHVAHMCTVPSPLLSSTENNNNNNSSSDVTTTATERQLQHQQEASSSSVNNDNNDDDDNTILTRNLWHKPDVYYSAQHGHQWHISNDTKPLLDEIQNKSFLFRGKQQAQLAQQDQPSQKQQKRLRPLTLLMEYPFAHTQNQHMMFDSMPQIEYNQQRLVELIMDITTPASRATLQNELGLDLKNVMVFDGFPQHFPTQTSAYTYAPRETRQDFINAGGYEGWQPEYGTTCRGPVPPTSIMTKLNRQQRRLFMEYNDDDGDNNNHLKDMTKWYGKTWEFTNQFWWGDVMWGGVFIDCTHPRSSNEGGPHVWKYFWQAMIDGHFEENEKELQ